jgi:pantoate--beta-alanine ligase
MAERIVTPRELFAVTEAWRMRGERVGLVPTLGALHDGHLALVDAVRAAGATRIVVSIFVNPLQFGANEDLAKYPRTLEDDVARCTERGVDLIYAPSVDAMYPKGFQTHVQVEQVTQRWEGSVRPEHFRGVATVVTKLFTATGACIAAFGRKDYQQLRTVQRLTDDLNLPVTILACPTIRELDGLAMSSRNRYLDASARPRARTIYQGMHAASLAFAQGERDAGTLLTLARTPVETKFDAIDYITIVDADDLTPISGRITTASMLLVAARIGATRLIDNCLLGEECLEARSPHV